MSEYEPRPATTGEEPDWRRLEVASRRFRRYISEGVADVLSEGGDIDDETARCIAHVLGRAFGQESYLAGFGRTGEGDYLALRDEYLDLYQREEISKEAKEHIDWFGSYLVQRENIGSNRRFMNEHLPPKLDQLLVHTQLRVEGQPFSVHIPASWHSGDVDLLIELLSQLELPKDPALQAFLSLPDVSAGTDNIVESFHEAFAGTFGSEEDALRALSPFEEWESQLADWCVDNGIEPEAVDWNLAPLLERLRSIYDLVEMAGRLHAFVK